ncbi:unnamed protein product [Leptosia nina]|uniref:Uncharacterized protein n=1 Tax=Leptosia nina TaxID=320188 RepID=A0AAV1K2Y4_9NEOP
MQSCSQTNLEIEETRDSLSDIASGVSLQWSWASDSDVVDLLLFDIDHKQKKMAFHRLIITITVLLAVVNAQRPFYAGLRPIGYPVVDSAPLLNRFGEDSDAPIEARGDGNLINRIEQMPIDKRPFWYLNSKQYDDLRRNPQTYPQRPSGFVSSG